MARSVPNENITKLIELTDRLCETPNDEYKLIVKKLKKILDYGKSKIDNSLDSQSKIKCYELMCLTITDLLTNVTF